MRKASSYRRGVPKFKAQPVVLVVCEDSKSSKTYFEDAANSFRATALVEFSHCGRTDPLGVVEAAIRRSRNFDRVYCVIDRDSHDEQNFAGALAAAATTANVTVLTSYPCFEFWLLLHFGYTRAPFMPAGDASAADRVIQQLRTKPDMEGYAKGSIDRLFHRLSPLLDQACVHAERTLRDAERDNEKNPSTPLHRLIIELRRLGAPVAA